MSLVAPQDNTLVMYYNSNAALQSKMNIESYFPLGFEGAAKPRAKLRWVLAWPPTALPTLPNAFGG